MESTTDQSTDEPHTGEEGDVVESKVKKEVTPSIQVGENANPEPYEGMVFESEEVAKNFYNEYARCIGFSMRVSMVRRSRRDESVISRLFVCSNEGFPIKKESASQIKRKRATTRVGCKAMMNVKKQNSGNWVVSKFEKLHNHALVSPEKVHYLRSHRRFSGPRSLQDVLHGEAIAAAASREESCGISNVGNGRASRQRILRKDIQFILDYFQSMQAENPGFFYAVQVDEDQFIGNIFWADARSRIAYNYFGDAITFDTMHKRNRYQTPFAPFMGMNHHRQPTLLGCALLLDESESSFLWLFKAWKTAMSGHHPVSLTTDQGSAIQAAASQVFPETCHRFCKWQILMKAQEKLADVYRAHPVFQGDFTKCFDSTVEEFESCWESLLDRYNLLENEWLQTLYNSRRQWVPAYLRDTFFAEFPTNPKGESISSFFDGYVNAQTTLQEFVRQYEKALNSWREKEVKADFDMFHTAPTLKTPSPMEKQAAELYSRKIFAKFQEELVETFVYTANRIEMDGATSTYRVAKFEEEYKAYTVMFDSSETRATCSCQMFEFSGILCRHILTVFKIQNIFKLPSCYILKRWTKNAKTGTILDEGSIEQQGSCLESLTVRYTNLHHEAIKYVEEGASSVDIYNAALCSLQEAMKKVASAKKNVPRVAKVGSSVYGSNQEDYTSEGSQADSMAYQMALPYPHFSRTIGSPSNDYS